MIESQRASVRDLLLTRRGLASVPPDGGESRRDLVRAVELELADLGYVLKTRLSDRLARCSLAAIAAFRSWAIGTLLAHIGGNQKHEPLFRRFPDGVPHDTEELWWKKVLVHYLQAEDQPCLFCGQTGTTHVLNPCCHVVCDQCFDGANYSACPVCEHHVDRSSPFFKPDVKRSQPQERVAFKLIDLAEDEVREARLLLASLCERTQALSPSDREALIVLVRELRLGVCDWLPEQIPVRENIAVIFGTLLQHLDAPTVLARARPFLTTATDVLRLIAVMSGTDGSLLSETIFREVERGLPTSQFWGRIAKMIGAQPPGPMRMKVHVPIRVFRFKVARLRRPLRRALLEVLEGLPQDRLVEDMLRHRSYWVWVGEFLHPHEYEDRYPKVARAFRIVRKKSDDGIPAPEFRGWYSRLERAFRERDLPRILAILSERPGEFARRLDFALRIAGDDAQASDAVVAAFTEIVSKLATPVLLTLASHLPTRTAKAQVRVYWPKGRVATGASTADNRKVLTQRIASATVRVIRAELLRRFSEEPPYAECLIDEELRKITVPFNERTASRAAVSIPRGSSFPVELGKTIRLFLHWCQPDGPHTTTDLDLSVAFYDAVWQFLGVCSYYQLTLKTAQDEVVATSSGDLQSAPGRRHGIRRSRLPARSVDGGAIRRDGD
jgi:Prokaryotic RING finger family 4